ncbi:lipocalin family protein, partial [Barnesiella intestinihominis]
MKKKNFIPFIAISVLCAACHDKTTLTGDWIEPVPGTTNTIQGFSLKENGEATSINMATLQYKSWTQEDNRLILSGESIGNHQTISFSDTLKIFKLSEDSLILKKGDLVKTYTRPKSIIPATPIQPAISTTFTVKGKLVIGHEVRSFIAEGDTTSYWIIDDSGTLKEEYEKTIGNNPKP